MRRAWSPTMLTNGKESGYGYGWFVATVNGEPQLRHHGESTGFTNAILKYPNRKLTIIVLTNRTGGAPWDTADRIAALFRRNEEARIAGVSVLARSALLAASVAYKVSRCRSVRSCSPSSVTAPQASRRSGDGIGALLGDERVTVVTTDDYHKHNRKARRELRLSALHPDCNDLDLLGEHLDQLANGKAVEKAPYNHATGRLRCAAHEIEPAEFLIVEGLLGLHSPCAARATTM